MLNFFHILSQKIQSISPDLVFWESLILLIIVCLVFKRKQFVKIVSNSVIAYNMIVITALGIFVSVFWGHASSSDNIHPVLEIIILCISTVLTFLAFWIQYQFNSIQQKDISHDRFENNFYRNVELLLKLESECVIPEVGSGKQAFHFMFYEYKAIMCQILMSDIVDWMSEGMNIYRDTADSKSISVEMLDKVDFWKKVNQISFNIFISGVSTSAKTRLYKDCGISKVQIEALNNYLIQRQHVEESPIYLDDYDCKNVRLYDGHRLRLVSFFRNVCMLVQFVLEKTDSSQPSENNRYLLYFLSLLSEHEISLLYIIYHYSTDEHKLFIGPYEKGINDFFTKILPKFIMASNMHPNDKDYDNFLNIDSINKARRIKY